jgi:hypothetical protein
MSFLKAIAKVPLAVFHWISSSQGQAIITAGEGVAVTLFPQLAGVVNLANAWVHKIIVTETIAEAAGSADGTGAQKAAAVLASIQPEIAKYFPTMTAAKIAEANSHLVAFLNAFEAPAAVTKA